MSQPAVQGEYYFNRQEMTAGFNFTADGKFQFFYSYGAVDRNATGSFSVEGETLKLKSDKVAGKDFTVKTQSKQSNGYSIEFKDANPFLLKNILCIFLNKGKQQVAYSDDEGIANMHLSNCDTIYVLHPLFPDIPTLIKDEKNDNNKFELNLNPTLAQVSFKGIDFKIVSEKEITCLSNYFMEMEKIKFVKP